MVNNTQLNIFEQTDPEPSTPKVSAHTEQQPAIAMDQRFSPGARISISNVGPPLEYLKGRTGLIMSLTTGFASVQVEQIAVPITLRVEDLELYVPQQYINEEESVLIRVGSTVKCDGAFLDRVGIVRRVGLHGGVAIAWVDYGNGRPLYPAPIDSLNLE